MATGDRIVRQRGITSFPLLGSEQAILLFRGSDQRFPKSFFPTDNLEGKRQLTNPRGETEAETGCQDCERPPWPPLAPLPHPGSRLFGNHCSPARAHAGRLWSLALRSRSGPWNVISAEASQGKSAEGISLRSGMTQSPEGWIQKIKRLQFFIWLSQNEKPSTYSLGALFVCFPKCYTVGNTNIK